MSSCNKTPVAVFHEWCVRNNIVEQYNVESVSGTPNDLLFKMSVETDRGLRAYGTGKTKKEAKHNAAQEALDKLNVPAILSGAQVSNALASPSVINPHKDRNLTGNSVGRLQEYCMVNGLPTPVYDWTGDEGEPHNRTFSVKCEVSRRYEIGIGRTKQLAKHNAAQAMYETLKNNPSLCNRVGTSEGNQIGMTSPELQDRLIEAYSLHRQLLDVPTTNAGVIFNRYPELMKTLLDSVKDDLSGESFTSPVETLEAIAEKLGLAVTYYPGHQIETTTDQDFIYAVVNTQPITVQLGCGECADTAKSQAALHVLKYWQVFVGIVRDD